MQFLEFRTKYFYLGVGVIIIVIYGVVMYAVIRGNNTTNIAKDTTIITPTPVSESNLPLPTSVKRKEPPVTITLAVGKPGIFTIVFPSKINPNLLTTTLVESTTDPSSPTLPVPFQSTFREDGKTMVITTTAPVKPNRFYSAYVRLKSNNHIVIKKRFQTTATEIIPINDSL